jgi:tetratricopeptide (TPR) repeat protein
MKSDVLKIFGVVYFIVFFALQNFSAETNSLSSTNTDATMNAYLQLQAQLHETQMQIEQSRETAAAEAASNAEAVNARLQQLEQTLDTQRSTDTEIMRRTQQLMFYLVGTIGLAGLAVLLLAGYFQWRAFSQLAEITARHGAALAGFQTMHQLAAPGRATVETSNERLLDVVGQLEKKILELESGGRLLAQPAAKPAADLLSEGQRFLSADDPEMALQCIEKFLTTQPQHAEALAKRASALEKMGRTEEALASCDRAIAANGSLVIAYLQKGGLLNRLNRYDEALKCYEQAMVAQEKKSPKAS